MMVTLTLSDQQIVDLVKQLPPAAKQTILDALITEREAWWDMTVAKSEEKMRKLAQGRGLDWNKMSEDEREKFVDDLMHA
jgi:TRAP-type C4-dicarboxylate transport system substrate-binding protein